MLSLTMVTFKAKVKMALILLLSEALSSSANLSRRWHLPNSMTTMRCRSIVVENWTKKRAQSEGIGDLIKNPSLDLLPLDGALSIYTAFDTLLRSLPHKQPVRDGNSRAQRSLVRLGGRDGHGITLRISSPSANALWNFICGGS